MKTAISIGSAYYNGEDWDDLVEYAKAADRLGVSQAWSAEAWGMDAIVPLAQAKEAFQVRYINEVLARNNGNRTKTARDLGVDPRTIFRHLEKSEPEPNEN